MAETGHKPRRAQRGSLDLPYAAPHSSPVEFLHTAGQWGLPLTVYCGQAFCGQDRFDQLLWRIEEN